MFPFTFQLSPADLRHVRAARGFFEFELYDDGWSELEDVAPAGRAAAEVLVLRVDILLGQDKTDYARTVATGAVRIHPKVGRCHYALALVEARSRDFPAAKESLGAAFLADPGLRARALKDERMAEFWRRVEE